MRKLAFLLPITLLMLSLVAIPQSPNASQVLLKKIQEDYWQHQLEEDMSLRMKFGLPLEKLPDVSREYAKKETDYSSSVLSQLKQLKIQDLTKQEQLSARILEWENANNVEAFRYFDLSSPLTPYNSPFRVLQSVFPAFQFRKEEDCAAYLKLIRGVPGFVKGMRDRAAAQLAKGIVLPKEELQVVVPLLQSAWKEPEESLFYVKEERLAAVSSSKQEFQKQLQEVISGEINTALKDLISFVSGQYADKAPASVGLSQYPQGKEFYKFLVRYHTSMDVTPEAVHKIGLDEMSKIDAQMEKIRAELKYQGTKAEFHAMLKSDPKFFPKTAEEVGERLMSYITRIEPKVKDYFLRTPKAPYGVQRLNPLLEGSMTFGYYQVPTPTEPKGLYMFNGASLHQRSLLWAGSLIYHELVPGHHFQINLQSENNDLPEFRRQNYPTSYVEGWGEYSSDLAGEMGMYVDPYDRYGRLAMKAFLTSRLVVDTGMNALGWSRAKAIDYMKSNLLISDTEISTETLRYSCDIPGQALAYKMGANKIMEIREKSRSKLKEKFDIRRFHDDFLSGGAMPLTVLESSF